MKIYTGKLRIRSLDALFTTRESKPRSSARALSPWVCSELVDRFATVSSGVEFVDMGLPSYSDSAKTEGKKSAFSL